MLRSLIVAAPVQLLLASVVLAEEPFTQPQISVPDSYTVELAAGPPLVEHPLMGGFDEKGRLYIAENAGLNLPRVELEKQLPNYISRLEDTDGDGKFDRRTVFADKLTFPQGALWHERWLYVASSGAIWRFKDKNDDGVADVRERIVNSFGYTGNAADVHGCFLGPEGRIWWCEGRHGHEIVDAAGEVLSKGKAARIFSCRPDGSDVQIHCGGGMDNPVEIDWTDSGEMLGTVNIMYQKRGDCLVHWMHGGVYPRHDQAAVLSEFRKTGDPLDAVFDYGHVAVSGCCRMRSFLPLPLGEGRGEGVSTSGKKPDPHPNPLPRGEGTVNSTFLVTEFNTHKVVRTDLFRDGSTFRAETTDFLQAASDDFHPTDVLEDADGSLLVIDTGGWFRIGCPTSQIAKPNILGAIYRVRKTGAKKINDPRGLAIEWNKLEAAPLIQLLADERPAVRERAIGTLARQKDAALPYLSRALTNKNATIRRNALWSLTRIGSQKAQETVRLVGLTERDPSVLAVAIYSAGYSRDGRASHDLCELLADKKTPPELLRAAATALGQIGSDEAVPTLMEALASDSDRVLEHALIYALIEIDNRDKTLIGLLRLSPRVRRAALIALDQMPSGNLTRDEVAALLDTTDQLLLTAALDVISRRPGWTDELVELAGKLLAQKALSEGEQSLLSGALVGLAKDEKVQALVGQTLARRDLPVVLQSLLLDVVGRSDLSPVPASWVESLTVRLNAADEAIVRGAIFAGASSRSPEIDAALLNVSRDAGRSQEIRLAALGAVAARRTTIDDSDFAFLCTIAAGDSPLSRAAAARLIGDAQLSEQQLLQLVDVLKGAGQDIGPILEPKFKKASEAVRKKLKDQKIVLRSDLAGFVPRGQFGDTQFNLEKIEKDLPLGGAISGKQIFFGRKAACSACHKVGSEGGKVGPDLTKVGERRSERDLLEAIVVPSASIARGFDSYTILTADGLTLTGLVVRETADSLFLRTTDQREIRVRRDNIEAQKLSPLSIMPAGLENTMNRQELADLLAFLRSLK
ncbi:MAG: HEAT repeat domain-containing protein [Pirellulaceae bacterium]|nr:HEAT repeat domain-containing protein [Pirellulaceae bacterium]